VKNAVYRRENRKRIFKKKEVLVDSKSRLLNRKKPGRGEVIRKPEKVSQKREGEGNGYEPKIYNRTTCRKGIGVRREGGRASKDLEEPPRKKDRGRGVDKPDKVSVNGDWRA